MYLQPANIHAGDHEAYKKAVIGKAWAIFIRAAGLVGAVSTISAMLFCIAAS